MMSSYALIHFLLGLPFQLLFQTTIVHTAIIPQSPSIAPTALSNDKGNCVANEGWVGDGIIKDDCAHAMSEFYRTNVLPRGGQEYEFYTLGGPSHSRFPTVLTPRKYDYGERPVPWNDYPDLLTQPVTIGTCVVVIAMLGAFRPGFLPGDTRREYQRVDTATFDQIYMVAVSVSSYCVNRKGEAEAGWSSTGKPA